MILHDDIITLRAPETADVDTMYLIENDTQLWSDGSTFAPVSRKQLWDYVESYDGNIFAAGQLRLIVMLNVDQSVVGVVDLYDYDRINMRAYVGITVAAKFRRQGIASRAMRLLIDYCRDVIGMYQLCAIVRANNEASKLLFARCQFVETGRFPQWIKCGSNWLDALHLQLLL